MPPHVAPTDVTAAAHLG